MRQRRRIGLASWAACAVAAVCAVTWLPAGGGGAWAQDADVDAQAVVERAGAEAKAAASRYAPALEVSTAVVLVVDVGAVEPEAIREAALLLRDAGPAAMAGKIDEAIAQGLPLVAAWRDAFVDAGGVEVAWMISVDSPDSPAALVQGMKVVARVKSDADVAAVERVMRQLPAMGGRSAARAGELMTFARADVDRVEGDAAGLAERAEALAEALALSPAGAVRLAVIPPPATMKALREAAGDRSLPEEMGGGSVGELVARARLGAAAVELRPSLTLHMAIKAPDARAAAALKETIDAALAVARSELAGQMMIGSDSTHEAVKARREAIATGISKLVEQVRPMVEGDTLRVRMTSAEVVTAMEAVTPALQEARLAARGIARMNAGRQIAIAVYAWAAEHDGALPPTLQSLTKMTIPPALLLSEADAAAYAQLDEAERETFLREHMRFAYVPVPRTDVPYAGTMPLVVGRAVDDRGLVTVILMDGSGHQMTAEAADTLLQEQTGASLAAWQAVTDGEMPEDAALPEAE